MDLSRRSFLGGMISVMTAAAAFKVTAQSLGNLPQIVGNGGFDDTAGFAALMRHEPVVFRKEMVGIDEYNGVICHFGRFKITSTIEVPDDCDLRLDRAQFVCDMPDLHSPLFRVSQAKQTIFSGINVGFLVKPQQQILQIKGDRRRDAEWIDEEKNALIAGSQPASNIAKSGIRHRQVIAEFEALPWESQA